MANDPVLIAFGPSKAVTAKPSGDASAPLGPTRPAPACPGRSITSKHQADHDARSAEPPSHPPWLTSYRRECEDPELAWRDPALSHRAHRHTRGFGGS